MGSSIVCTLIIFLSLTSTALTKPIMVTFGTNQGPIVPRPPKLSTLAPRIGGESRPAPVSESVEDLPNPSTYRPLVPHQYQTRLHAHKPSPNLIFGTPLDIKYTPNLNKYDIYKKAEALGKEYTGPHIFEPQEYEKYIDFRSKTLRLLPSVRYIKPQYYEHKLSNSHYVPEIGIIYSSGVRYYIPQYLSSPSNEQEQDIFDENSVYDKNDQKYYSQNY